MFKSFLRPRSKSSPEPMRPPASTTSSACIPMKLERMRLESKLYFPKKVVHAIDSRQDAVPPQLNFSFGDYLHVLSHKDIGGTMSYEVYNPVTKETGLVPTTCFREVIKEPQAPTKPIGMTPGANSNIAYPLPPGIPVLAELVRLYKDGVEYIFHLLVHYQPDVGIRDSVKYQKRQRSQSAPPIMELSLNRTWADFTTIESSLVDAFPVEAGKTRQIPILPFLSPGSCPINHKNRSHFAYSASQYLKSLVSMQYPKEIVEVRCHGDMYYNNVKLLDGEHVLRSDLVRQFFSLRPGDIVLPHAENVSRAPKSQIDDLADATGATMEHLGIYDQVWRPHEQVAKTRCAQREKGSNPQSVTPSERPNDSDTGTQPSDNLKKVDTRLKIAAAAASKKLKLSKDKYLAANA